MTIDEFNHYCKALPHTTHVVQWGNSEVWKVGGKVFAIGSITRTDTLLLPLKHLSKTIIFWKKSLAIGLRPISLVVE